MVLSVFGCLTLFTSVGASFRELDVSLIVSDVMRRRCALVFPYQIDVFDSTSWSILFAFFLTRFITATFSAHTFTFGKVICLVLKRDDFPKYQ